MRKLAVNRVMFRRVVLLSTALWCWFLGVGATRVTAQNIAGRVTDPQGNGVAGGTASLFRESGELAQKIFTDAEGRFAFSGVPSGKYTLNIEKNGFELARRAVMVEGRGTVSLAVQLRLVTTAQEVRVSTDVVNVNVESPDPAQRVIIRAETLDANPGRPGAPVSIPGLPTETASGGIKAPQYFAPGVAGDHGEPIASYIQVGSFLASNNLSANAHGNGYADPNILIAQVIGDVVVDGGAFNVKEGNHSQNLSVTYGLRERFDPFFVVTVDHRDVDAVAGFSPDAQSWIAGEASYGNGFLERLEHRKQFKVNGWRDFEVGNHQLTVFGIGYYRFSYIPGLTPIGIATPNDTIDSRQKDQTHTGEIVLNDVWSLTSAQKLQLSGFFRTYNLALYSDFGDVIRQSEFRTVAGGNAAYVNNFRDFLSLLAGVCGRELSDCKGIYGADHRTTVPFPDCGRGGSAAAVVR